MLLLILALFAAAPALAIRAAWVGDSITESSPVTCVTRDPVGVLCDLVCPGAETCTSSGEYTNATASAPDAAGNGVEYTCASNSFTIRNLGDSGDQMVVEGATRYNPHVSVGKPVVGSTTATTCPATACAAGEVCKAWGGFCSVPYDVLVVLYGHNDNRSGAGPPGQIGTDGETAAYVWDGAGAASLRSLVKDACELHQMKVVMVSVLPYRGGGGWTAAKETERLALNSSMSDFVTSGGDEGKCTGRVFYANAETYVDTTSDGLTQLDGSCDGDSIHPDSATCVKLGTAVFTEARGAFP